jgi:hypothetical protein
MFEKRDWLRLEVLIHSACGKVLIHSACGKVLIHSACEVKCCFTAHVWYARRRGTAAGQGVPSRLNAVVQQTHKHPIKWCVVQQPHKHPIK